MKADRTCGDRGMDHRVLASRVHNATAFTLVELLVVIGVIAVLIAILLPALSRAQQAAKNVNCLSNLRQLAQGGHNYAADHKGHLPYDFGNGNAPWRSYLVASGSNKYVRDEAYTAGWGFVFSRGYIKTARIFYCPWSFGTGSNNDFYLYWGKVGTGVADWRTKIGGQRTRAAYMFNPYMIEQLARPSKVSPILAAKAPSIDNLPAVKQIMAMDILHASTTHQHPQPTWNIATLDGAAQTYRCPPIIAMLNGGGVPGDNWLTFDNYMDLILGRK